MTVNDYLQRQIAKKKSKSKLVLSILVIIQHSNIAFYLLLSWLQILVAISLGGEGW